MDHDFFKTFSTFFSPLLEKLFNSALNSDSYRTSWAQSIIVPISKKGDKSNPDNYRGKTLLSHLSKLLISILNIRLLKLYVPTENNCFSVLKKQTNQN
jgi:hypothetical protein